MLKQSEKNNATKDGMDIAVCIFNSKNNNIEFSGANNPLFIIRDNDSKMPDINDKKKIKMLASETSNHTLIEYKPDRQPIGVYIKERPFTNHKITLCENDSLYLFSDGYVDQFDSKNKSKFLIKNFKKLLLSIADKTMPEQQKILDKTFKKWIGNSIQTDDILVMGVRI